VRTFVPTGPGSFYRWLVTLANHQIGNRAHYVRAKGRRDVQELAGAGGTTTSLPILDTVTSIVSQAARREAVRRADATLATMPPEERTLVELTYLEGLSIRAAAERAGVPRSSTFRSLQAGMSRLRQAMAPTRT
jgi:RNA polymerase sigma factor (sigma-70 family)